MMSDSALGGESLSLWAEDIQGKGRPPSAPQDIIRSHILRFGWFIYPLPGLEPAIKVRLNPL